LNLFGTPQGSPRTDKLIDASIQWAERIMRRIDAVFLEGLGFFRYPCVICGAHLAIIKAVALFRLPQDSGGFLPQGVALEVYCGDLEGAA
jgi:hypothetical protein